MEELEEPVELFGDEITERVASVTWSGGRIGPGEFDEFGMSVRLPEEVGQELVFPALQTYANGEVVRWIGPPDADARAPRVALTPLQGAEEPAASGAGDDAAQAAEATASGATESAEKADTASSRANVALGLGAAGLVAGLGALAIAFFRSRTT